MIDVCLMMAGSFRATCEHARGLRAGAIIAVPGGLRAEEVVAVKATDKKVSDRVEFAVAVAILAVSAWLAVLLLKIRRGLREGWWH